MKKNQILGLVRDSEELFTCTYLVQNMYEYNVNDNNYTISSSNNITKIRTFEKTDDLTNENIVTLEYKNGDCIVTKYVHALRSTIEARTYSFIDGGNLSFDEAKEIILASLEKIKSIDAFDKYIDMDKIILFLKELNVYGKSY